jgi:hypothetical protein
MKIPKLYKGKYLMSDYYKQTDCCTLYGHSAYPERMYITALCRDYKEVEGIALNWDGSDKFDRVIVLPKDGGRPFMFVVDVLDIMMETAELASLGQTWHCALKS